MRFISFGGHHISASVTIDTSSPLSTSELVLFNGEEFAKKVMLGNVKLMHIDASVSNAQLGGVIISAAELADETSGNITHKICDDKVIFGLRKVKTLYASPPPHQIDRPVYSL